MKTRLTLTIIGILLLTVTSCKEQASKVEEIKIDLITAEFPEAKQEVMQSNMVTDLD